jgi:23S rRNA U2552 (ribose-2'-O)-methylase RlmE/FtsJ
MMKSMGRDMHQATGAFALPGGSPSDPPRILDMCVAPGGFLAAALELNPGAEARGFSLQSSKGGHKMLMPKDPNVTINFLDITMLAADMGVTHIPPEHPDAKNFLTRRFFRSQRFDLVVCDGQVLRTQERASYREAREARRLVTTQLAFGLERLKSGGTMVVLLHKAEVWPTVLLLKTFSMLSSVQLFKSSRCHAIRSSFYMVATNIQSQQPAALSAVGKWKEDWKIATFGTEEECKEHFTVDIKDEEALLQDFGPQLIKLGREIWGIQARALEHTSFIKTK